MPDNPSLLQQLANRAKTFHSNTGIPQTSMAKAIGMDASNYNAFLQGKKGLGAESTCLLLKFIAMSKREAIAKFSKPAPTSKILHLQQNDIRKMRLAINDGRVPGQSGVDPNDAGNGIDNTPDADTTGPVWDQDLIDTLREARGYHRLIVRAINSFIQNAKANRDGSTAATAQRFSTRNIIKTMCFATDDAPTATKDLLAVFSTLDPQTRTRVISSILAAFPQFTRT